MNQGGKRKGAGRKVGSTIGNVKMGISISEKNYSKLQDEKISGKNMSKVIDLALDAWFELET